MGAQKFIISGGRPLRGEVMVSGSKNAALAIIPAALLTKETCVLENVPAIEDVRRLIEIMQSMGADVSWERVHTLRIRAVAIDPKKLDQTIVGRLRASILFLGPLLARTGSARIRHPGGDLIGARPVKTHLAALETLGARVEEEGASYALQADRLSGGAVVLREFSVTATENALMAAALARGSSVIRMAAEEPHVVELARFLRKMGADIRGAGTHNIFIKGVRRLKGARHRIQGDPIEAGTFAAAFAATGGQGVVNGVDPNTLTLPIEKLREAGVPVEISKYRNFDISRLVVKPALHLEAISHPGIQTLPYPGFPTDLQAPFAVLATQLHGTTMIQEPLYEGRLKYIHELRRMGAKAKMLDPHRALITGPTPLHGTTIAGLDLRAGATLVIAALVARGTSTIGEIYHIDRGYERIEEKLQRLGAEIRRVSA